MGRGVEAQDGKRAKGAKKGRRAQAQVKVPEGFAGRTLVRLVLDKSGSMGPLVPTTLSAVNEYLATLKREQRGEVLFGLTLFDTEFSHPWPTRPLAEVPALDQTTYVGETMGMTALYDAVGYATEEVQRDLRDGDRALVVIFTDGFENSSRQYTLSRLRETIARLQGEGNWTFAYMGANQDAWMVGGQMNIPVANTMSLPGTPQGVAGAMSRTSGSTAGYMASAGGQSASFYGGDPTAGDAKEAGDAQASWVARTRVEKEEDE